MTLVKIFLRAGNFRGGNSHEDVLVLATLGPTWFEMDFHISKHNCLLSGHDSNTYAVSGYPAISHIDDPNVARNRRGGRCATLAQVLTHMPAGSRLFIDLKDTMHRDMRNAVKIATAEVRAACRIEEAVLMVYVRNAAACELPNEFTSCLKLKRHDLESERQAIAHIETAAAIGARYCCAPVPTTYHQLPRACLDAGVTLVVPLPHSGRPKHANDERRGELLSHLENGVRHFICNFDSDWLSAVYSEFLDSSAATRTQCELTVS